MIAFVFGPGLHRERVGAGTRLAQTVGADRVGRQPRDVFLLLGFSAVIQKRVDRQRVVHVDADADRGVDAGELLDGKAGHEKRPARSAVLFTRLYAHQPEFKTFLNDLGADLLLLVHLAVVWFTLELRVISDTSM